MSVLLGDDGRRVVRPASLLVPDQALEADGHPFDLGDAEVINADTLAWESLPADMTMTARLGSPHPITFYRELKYRLGRSPEGRDVLAVSRALHQHGFRSADATMIFGWRMRDNVELFRRHQNMNAIGVYDRETHRHLTPLFDSYGRWLYTHHDHQPPQPSPDQRIDSLMHALWSCYAMRPWVYRAIRPFMLYAQGTRIRYTYDCSWFFKQVYYMAGLPSPDQDGYQGGYGNTESLRVHGRAVIGGIQPGDGIFYGEFGNRNDPAHVAMASGNGMCIGFGSSGGPWLEPQNYRPIRTVRRYVVT